MTAFGVANVGLHRLAALVRLHEGGRALEYLHGLDASALSALPRERRVNYLLDVAEAHKQCGQLRSATTAVLSAERVAPEEVRCRSAAHHLIRTLLESASGRPSQELRRLALRVGMPA